MCHLQKAISTLEGAGFVVEFKKSSGGRGFHVIGWRKQPIKEKDLFELRLKAGDDVRRVEFDAKKMRAIQVLFSKKSFGKISLR